VLTSQILMVVSSEPEQRYLESDDQDTSDMPWQAEQMRSCIKNEYIGIKIRGVLMAEWRTLFLSSNVCSNRPSSAFQILMVLSAATQNREKA